MNNPTIVSLIASATEIVCALGFEKNLVGRSHECDYPPSIQNLPVCTGPKFVPDGSSQEIHQKVQNLMKDALSVYWVDSDQLKKLSPSVLLTQTQCEVCAVSLKDVKDTISQELGNQCQILSLEAQSLNEIFKDIEKVAELLGISERGENLIGTLKNRLEKINGKIRKGINRPRVLSIEWMDPLMAAGHWVPEIIDLAGGEDLLGKAGQKAPYLDWSLLEKMNPDILLLMPCGFDIDRINKEMGLFTKNPVWKQLKAVKNNRVYLTDGNQYFNRPGPRIIDSAEILAEIFHPKMFPFGYKGKGYVNFQ